MARNSRHKQSLRRTAQAPVVIELQIDSIGAQGDGVGVVDGAAVFVPYTAPGDVVLVERSGPRATLREIVTRGPARRAPICPLFGRCGGCALQHLGDGAYADFKRGLAVEAARRAGADPQIVAPLLRCPPASRRRATFSVKRAGANFIFGYNERSSARIVDVGQCPVLDPALATALGGLREIAALIAAVAPVFDIAATLCNNGVDIDIQGAVSADDIDPPTFAALAETMRAGVAARLSFNAEPLLTIIEPQVTFGALTVTPPPGGFLQASRAGETQLAALVETGLDSAAHVADLFSGCGAFAGRLAARSKVDAFDADGPAIEALSSAADHAGFSGRLRAVRRNLFSDPLPARELKSYDGVVFDPPRAGAKAQAQMLAASAVPRIVAVSCNPASFSRDAAALIAGGYTLSRLTPVDQFVYAAHLELVGVFEKR